MAPKVQTPVKGYTGKVAGVTFADGVGETEDPAALAYFERHGYEIGAGDEGKEPSPKEKLQAEAKALGLDDAGKVDELKARIAEHKAAAEKNDGGKGDEGKEPA
ncbi:hypothetical protein MUN78_04450 [Leucobacter allii]|uniref:Phage protein n=1 Tax=Leucobacter allii TaxID=2932247 RepID=A0ABY4FPA6_9MICO|nr:hypothetical protein [Leucobacter allii]UOQ58102.1 hypothetical protein MUN78_04450 [Leucobacter allii]